MLSIWSSLKFCGKELMGHGKSIFFSLHMQGATQLLDLKVDKYSTYEHHSNICEFQDSLSEVNMSDIVDKVSKSGKFKIMLDESTDISQVRM